LDDGARDLAESVEMAKIAYADGTRHMIATPHFSEKFLTDKDLVLRRIDELQTELDRQGIGVTVHPGNEVRIDSPLFVEKHVREGGFHYLARPGKFILIEQRWTDYERDTPRIMAALLDKGITPILPHPERHFFFRESPELLVALIEAGVWTQVTADSLIGSWGEEAQSFAEWLADRDYIHTLASDAHNVERKPNLSEGYRIVAERIHRDRADEIRRRAEQILA
jgi:protein-tyrosine phosphatase